MHQQVRRGAPRDAQAASLRTMVAVLWPAGMEEFTEMLKVEVKHEQAFLAMQASYTKISPPRRPLLDVV